MAADAHRHRAIAYLALDGVHKSVLCCLIECSFDVEVLCKHHALCSTTFHPVTGLQACTWYGCSVLTLPCLPWRLSSAGKPSPTAPDEYKHASTTTISYADAAGQEGNEKEAFLPKVLYLAPNGQNPDSYAALLKQVVPCATSID